MAENTKQFFQITEAARACGLSRSTLMRMEERGLLTPVFTAPDSGRRYYDNHNVARIMQIEKFKAMGLGSKEIADYFAQGGEAEVLLEALETRLRDLQRSVEEMRLRAAEGESLSVQMMELPAVTCRIRWCEGLTTAERYRDMYDFYGACVRKGCVLSDEPLFTISERTDYLEGYIGQEPYRYGVCAGAEEPGGGGRSDAGGVPGAVGAVLRRLQRRWRGVADAGAGGKGAGAEARRRAAGAGHRGAVHGAGDRDAAVLLAAGAAGGGIMGSGRPAVQVSRFCYTNL